MEWKAVRQGKKTIFYTKNIELLTSILIKAGVKDIKFIEGASIMTTHLDKRITDDQAIKYRYEVSKMRDEDSKRRFSDKGIITGFAGCLVTGIMLRYF